MLLDLLNFVNYAVQSLSSLQIWTLLPFDLNFAWLLVLFEFLLFFCGQGELHHRPWGVDVACCEGQFVVNCLVKAVILQSLLQIVRWLESDCLISSWFIQMLHNPLSQRFFCSSRLALKCLSIHFLFLERQGKRKGLRYSWRLYKLWRLGSNVLFSKLNLFVLGDTCRRYHHFGIANFKVYFHVSFWCRGWFSVILQLWLKVFPDFDWFWFD